LNHDLLLGAFPVKVDPKNRIPIPSELRSAIVSDKVEKTVFVILVGINRKVWLYSDRYYRRLVNQRKPQLLPERGALAFDHLNFGLAHKREMDNQGRVLIPDSLLKRTNTEKSIMVIGVRDHMELWNPSDWDAWVDELEQGRDKIADDARAVQ
jgi:MraZ protein